MRWLQGMMAVGVVVCGVPAGAHASEITIGMATAPSSADPHFHQVTPNNILAAHVFDPLITTDAESQLRPDLAKSWTLENGRTWRLDLRQDVVFHDGTKFTSADVIYSLCRVLHPSGPTASFQIASRALEAAEAPDDHTVLLTMHQPNPGFLSDLSSVAIISAHSAGATNVKFSGNDACGDIPAPPASAFDSGAMANGTGPYRLVSYTSGTSLTLAANPHYHGAKPRWDKVTMRALPNAAARSAALLAGEVDLIENPSAQDLPTLKRRGGLAVSMVPSNRIIYLQLDVARDPSPLTRGRDGSNKLRDPRVREAISLAIDRAAIGGRLMDGMGVPANQYATAGLFGSLTDQPKPVYDPARARKLLTEAGADGMTLTLSATNDRYISDAVVAQAVGQYLTRVGIQTTVDVMPAVSFFPRRAKREFSVAMGGWGYSSEGAANFLRIWLATTDAEHGLGQSNYGGYRNDAFNAPLVQALTEMDDAKRASLLQQAERSALHDNAIIPLYWETSVWAFKDKYTYAGRADQRTNADDLMPKGK